MPLREKGMRHPPPTSLLRAKGIAPLALISQSAPLGLGIGMRRDWCAYALCPVKYGRGAAGEEIRERDREPRKV